MSSFKDLRKKISLKRFHQKIDEFEERIEEKIKQCWRSVISFLSAKKDKEVTPKVEEIKSEDVKIEKEENLKDKKKIKPPLKTKKATPSKSNKVPVKSVVLEKKTSIKVKPKPAAKPKLKSTGTAHIGSEKTEIRKDEDIVNVESQSPDNLVSSTSKRRGRPKKEEEIKMTKVRSVTSNKVTKIDKNTKKSK